ncbi:MAG: peptidoglycan DD-metalloendopeptidase family protein [Bacillota bacterium]
MKKYVLLLFIFALIFSYGGFNLINSSNFSRTNENREHEEINSNNLEKPEINTKMIKINLKDDLEQVNLAADDEKNKSETNIDKIVNNPREKKTKNNDDELNNIEESGEGSKVVLASRGTQINRNDSIKNTDDNEQEIIEENQEVLETIQEEIEVDNNVEKSDNIDEEIQAVSVSSIVEEVEPVSLMDEIISYRVKRGDNLWNIADAFGIDIDTLIGANDITNMNTIKVGDVLNILPVKGIVYKVNPGESLWTISRKFKVSINDIAEANALANPDLVKPGMTLLLQGAKPEFGYEDRLGRSFINPINTRISSYFGPRWGKMHEGIDFAVNIGTPVKASRAGKIIYSGWASGYGHTIVIEHQKGVRTLYAHNSKLLVHGGQWVKQGQDIALSGNSGRSTGPHLHFEIQINGKPVDPMNYIK